MTRKLADIPVAVIPTEGAAGTPGNVVAVLHEIEFMLESLLRHGQTNSIDLRRSPLTPADCHHLQEVLGQGEASAEVDALGLSRVRETAVSGVWWVTHSNTAGKVVGEFIEVARCPELLMTPGEALLSGQARLRQLLDPPLPQVEREDNARRRLEAMGLRPARSGPSDPNANNLVK